MAAGSTRTSWRGFLKRVRNAVRGFRSPIAEDYPQDGNDLLAQIKVIRRKVDFLVESQTIYIGEHEALTSTRHGARMYVDTRSLGIASPIMWTGRWEPRIEAALLAAARPGDTVCDLGANFGYYTIGLALRVGPAGRVIAVEANPHIFAKLKKTVQVNGFAARTSLHNVAIADRAGTMTFNLDDAFSGGGSLVFRGKTGSIEVEARPLDEIVPPDVLPAVIKMDVEGAEALALAGGERVFSHPAMRWMVMEFTPVAVARRQPPVDFLGWFVAHGYRLRAFSGGGLTGPLTPGALLEHIGGRMSNIVLDRG